jgi:hypothetical protein
MTYLFYKGNYIVASAAVDEPTGRYYPIASISWEKSTERGVHVIRNAPERCESVNAATDLAVELAKAWIERKLSLQ